MSLNIAINTIPHEQHRYPTVGDYFLTEKGVQQLLISDMNNKDYEFLVALHELIEQHLTEKRGISEQAITEFDKAYESQRQQYNYTHDVKNFDEPGDDFKSPYFNEHKFATKIEQLMAQELGVDWEQYDKTVCEL